MTNRSWRVLAPALLALASVLCGSLSAQAAAVARSKADRVNVRSRAGFSGEVITQLSRGQEVTILGTNVLSQPAADEPPVWYRIVLPSKAKLWVAADYISADGKVTADILNVRAGPGLEYAAVARVPQGTQLEKIGEPKDGWVQIAAPAGAFGYVPEAWVTFGEVEGAASTELASTAGTSQTRVASSAAVLTDTAATARPTTTTTTTVAPTASFPVATSFTPSRGAPPPGTLSPAAPADFTKPQDYSWFEQFVVQRPAGSTTRSLSSGGVTMTSSTTGGELTIPSTTDTWLTTQPPAAAPAQPAATSGAVQSHDLDAAAESQPPIPPGLDDSTARYVRREGLVIRPFNFAAPTYYALEARDSGKTINFLFSTRPEPIPWREYRGRVVIVSGREYLDQRTYWRGVPLLDVEEIEAVR